MSSTKRHPRFFGLKQKGYYVENADLCRKIESIQ